jgi:DNA-binding MarR family transcriptional regulator
MRTINATSTTDADMARAVTRRIVDGLHDIIAGFRCAGTGKLVKLGVSMTQMHVLWILQHHGEMPMSRMAELMDVSLSNATGIIDRMEERGLIERVRVPDDRRVVVVRITPGGLQAMDAIEAIKQDRLEAILQHLDGTQLERLALAMDDMRDALVAEGGFDHDHASHHHKTSGRD